MPRIPQEAQQRSVVPSQGASALQDSSAATAKAFGFNPNADAEGAGLKALGGAVQAYAIKQQDDDNINEAKRLDTEYAKKMQHLLNGNPDDPNSVGYYQLSNREAVDRAAEFRKAADKIRNDTLGSASTQDAAKALKGQVDQRDLAYQSGFQRHFGKEKKAAELTESTARIAVGAQDAALNSADPAEVANQLGLIRGEVATSLDQQGITDPDAIKNKQVEATTVALEGVVAARLADNDPDGAMAYLTQYKVGIQATVYAKLIKAVKSKVDIEAAQSLLQESEKKCAAGDFACQLKFIDGTKNGSVKAETLKLWTQRVNRLNALDKRTDDAEDEANALKAQTKLDKFRADGKDRKQILAEIDKMKAGKLKTELQKQFNTSITLDTKVRAEAKEISAEAERQKKIEEREDKAFKKLFHDNALQKAQENANDPSRKLGDGSIAPEEWNVLTISEQNALKKAELDNSAPFLDAATTGSIGLLSQIKNADANTLRNPKLYDLPSLRAVLTEGQWNEAEKLINGARSKNPKDIIHYTRQDKFKTALGKLKFSGNKKAQDRAKAGYRDMFSQTLDRMEAEKGERLNTFEVDDAMNEILKQVVTDEVRGGLPGLKASVFNDGNAPPRDLPTIFRQMPEGEAEKIRLRLQQTSPPGTIITQKMVVIDWIARNKPNP